MNLPVLQAVVSCDGCGACCMHLDTPPFMDYERQYVPEELMAEIDAITSKQTFYDENGGPCLWWDPVTKRCKHYEDRPDVCEWFQVGEEDCLLFRKMRGVS